MRSPDSTSNSVTAVASTLRNSNASPPAAYSDWGATQPSAVMSMAMVVTPLPSLASGAVGTVLPAAVPAAIVRANGTAPAMATIRGVRRDADIGRWTPAVVGGWEGGASAASPRADRRPFHAAQRARGWAVDRAASGRHDRQARARRG